MAMAITMTMTMTMTMAMRARVRQGAIATVILVVGVAAFLLVELLITPRHRLETGLDRAIPFVPLTLPLYLAFFPYVVAASVVADRREFLVVQAATVAALAIAIGCFCLFPVTLPRPDPALIDNAFLRRRFSRLWRLDAATNGFPSLHVAATCIATWALARRRRHGWLAVVFAALICASTLTVKQHTILDVLGGAALALGSLALARRLIGRPTALPARVGP